MAVDRAAGTVSFAAARERRIDAIADALVRGELGTGRTSVLRRLQDATVAVIAGLHGIPDGASTFAFLEAERNTLKARLADIAREVIGRNRPVSRTSVYEVMIKPAPAVEMPQPAVAVDAVEPAVEAEPLEVAPPVEEAAEPAAPPVESRKAKAPRKPRARRAKAPAEPKAREPVVIDEAEFTEIVSFEDVAHPPIAPLFEPEPFARMPRRAFGRRGQI